MTNPAPAQPGESVSPLPIFIRGVTTTGSWDTVSIGSGLSTVLSPPAPDVTAAGVVIPMPVVMDILRNVAEDYARQLHAVWPEAKIYLGTPREAGTVRVLVVSDRVDLDMEDAAYNLMWTKAADDAALFIDVDVWFQDRCEHDLGGLERLA